MDSNQDVDARIAQLEHELAELRTATATARPRATRVGPQPAMPRRRLSAFWIAASLFALSLPVATWLHGEARGAQAAKLQRRALYTEMRLDLAARRHDVATRFVGIAMDADRPREDRDAALRYLSEQLKTTSKLRRWARAELARGDEGKSCKRKQKALREAREREQAQEQMQRASAQRCGG